MKSPILLQFRTMLRMPFVDRTSRTVGGCGQLEGPEADVVQSLVVDAVRLVGVLDELVHGERRVVGLDDGVGHLRRRHHRERVHDPVGVLLADLGDEEGSHPRPGATTQGMCELEALQTVTGLGLLAHHIENRVHELRAFRVVSLRPVVSSAALSEHEVVRAEDLSEGAGADGVHGAGFQIDEHGAGHVLAAGRLIVVDVDALELQVRVAVVGAGRVDPVFVGDHLSVDTDVVKSLGSG